MVILGIDPGSRVTGYGIISSESNRVRCLEYGGVRALTGGGSTSSFAGRLREIYLRLYELIERHSPQAVAVEEVFHAVNVNSALKLGHARGIVFLAAAQFDVPLFEYSPLEVKKAVTGYGRAEKLQIQMMVRTLLRLKEKPQPHDAADALAVALCHAFKKVPNQHTQ